MSRLLCACTCAAALAGCTAQVRMPQAAKPGAPRASFEFTASPALNDFLWSVVPASRNKHMNDGIRKCVADTVSETAPVYATAAIADVKKAGQSKEAFLLSTLLQTHPELAPLLECLVRSNLVEPDLYVRSGSKLLFVALSFVGMERQPTALMDALSMQGPMYDFVLDPVRDAYNILHKALDRDKMVLGDLVSRLLHPNTSASYYEYLSALVDSVAQRLPQQLARNLRAAASRLASPAVHASPRGSARVSEDGSSAVAPRTRVIGHAVNAGDVLTLSNAMSMLVIVQLQHSIGNYWRASSLRQGAPPTQGGEANADPRMKLLQRRLPSLSMMLSQRDKFGRSPFHMAALANNPASATHMMLSLVEDLNPNFPEARANATRAIFLTDVFGYTPRQLAVALGHKEVEDALIEAEKRVKDSHAFRFRGVDDEDALIEELLSKHKGSAKVEKLSSELAQDAGLSADEDEDAGRGDDVQGEQFWDEWGIGIDLKASVAPYNAPLGRRAAPLRRAFKRAAPAPAAAVPPMDPTFFDDKAETESNGGWTAPQWASEQSRAALDIAWRHGAAARDCDFDVLSPANITADRFVHDYFVPGRPFVVRGLATHWPARVRFQRDALLLRHGHMNFSTGDIPYSATFGHQQRKLTLAQYVAGVLFCSPQDGRLHLPQGVKTVISDSKSAVGVDDSLCSMFLPAELRAPVADAHVSEELPTPKARSRAERKLAKPVGANQIVTPGARSPVVQGDAVEPHTAGATTRKAKDPQLLDASSGRAYIFNYLDSSVPIVRRLVADMQLLPDFVNTTLPHFTQELVEQQLEAHHKKILDAGVVGEAEEALRRLEESQDDWGLGASAEEATPHDTAKPVAPPTSATPRRIEVEVDNLLDGKLQPQFYVGPPGSGAPMHYHEDAVNTLMFGEKRWYLSPPLHAVYSTVPIAEWVTHELPRISAQASPHVYQCTQMAGDVMYVPHGWGHAVLNMRTSVGYAVEFATPFERY